ncbi:MAG TPA: hypothetical protein VMF06_10005 [Candidatus Limnocylindria bacterium]|jgi:hypothetical protein|nr:hypothetical protein [Candidatus Limnocylindria bacterium]
MNRFIKVAAGFALGFSVVLTPSALGAEKPKYTIEEVMKAINKGEDNIGKRISKGTASTEDIKKMVEYYSSLPLNEPPQGDAKVWKQKTLALVAAAHALEKGEAGATDKFKEAVSCKACHKDFKPDKEKH